MRQLELESKRDSKNSKSFTLIEVLVSVIILSVVGIALLDMASKNTKTLSYLSKKKEIPMILSVVAFHGNPDMDNLEKNLYDIVSKEYKIDSLVFKEYLNSKKLLYKEDEVDRVNLAKQEKQDSQMSWQINIFKQSIAMKKAGGYLFTIRVDSF